MTARLIRTSADWIAALRARIKVLGLTHLEVDERAGLSEGHTGKVLCGMRKPSLLTIEKLCRALNLFVAIESADGRSSFAENAQLSDSSVNERSNHVETTPEFSTET